jgi:mono/diheme cytochrome c family protein
MCSNYCILLLPAIILLVAACATALYIPEKGNVAAGADIGQLKMGRKLYVEKCSSCHSLILPEKHTDTEWKTWMDKVSQRSKLTLQ